MAFDIVSMLPVIGLIVGALGVGRFRESDRVPVMLASLVLAGGSAVLGSVPFLSGLSNIVGIFTGLVGGLAVGFALRVGFDKVQKAI